MEELSDNALMCKVKSGDLDPLGLLYERYKRPIFGYFYHQVKDKMISEDLVQAVFIRVMKYRGSFKEENAFKSWLFQIARNIGHDHFNKHKTHYDELNDEHMKIAPPQDDDNEIEERLNLMEKALSMIDAEKREILTLSKLKALKYKEVGAILNCSENTVKIKVFRAIKALKIQYQKLETAAR